MGVHDCACTATINHSQSMYGTKQGLLCFFDWMQCQLSTCFLACYNKSSSMLSHFLFIWSLIRKYLWGCSNLLKENTTRWINNVISSPCHTTLWAEPAACFGVYVSVPGVLFDLPLSWSRLLQHAETTGNVPTQQLDSTNSLVKNRSIISDFPSPCFELQLSASRPCQQTDCDRLSAKTDSLLMRSLIETQKWLHAF